MATILPFRGVLYNPAVVGDVAQVVAPPYDVIDARAQRALYARHPNNVVRLELGLDEPGDDAARNKYQRAATALRAWLASGALARDPAPAVYPYTIEYRVPGGGPGETRLLKGFLATVVLEEFGEGRIYPHENTRSAAKADRLRLPALPDCLARLEHSFAVELLPFTPATEAAVRERFLGALRLAGETGRAFGLALEGAGAYALLTLKPGAQPAGASAKDRLDVSVLHGLALPALGVKAIEEADVVYTKSEQEALDLVRRGEVGAAVLLNPTKVAEVREVAAAGDRMPHKSTYFFPKPLTGLVLNVME